jgi:hypothetical protein
MYAKADSMGRRLYTSPLWNKTFGAPLGPLAPTTQFALDRAGWNAYRTLATGRNFNPEFYTVPQVAPANNDSLLLGAPSQYARHVRNMSGVIPNESPLVLVGAQTDLSSNPAHIPRVKRAMHRAIWASKGQNIRSMMMFAHDFKTGGTGNYATGGVQGDELGALCTVADSLGVRYMTTGEYVSWVKAYATPVDYPYGAVKPEMYALYQNDEHRVWMKPYGVDGRWIRNVADPVFPALVDPPKAFCAVDSGFLTFYPRIGLTAYLPPQSENSTITVRILDHNTQAVIGTRTSDIAWVLEYVPQAELSTGSTPAVWPVIADGTVIDILYTSDAAYVGHQDVTVWTMLLEGYVMDHAAIEAGDPLIYLDPEVPTQ